MLHAFLLSSILSLSSDECIDFCVTTDSTVNLLINFIYILLFLNQIYQLYVIYIYVKQF